MKLVLVGGGGVRSPLFVMSLLNWQKRIGVDELCLMDTDARKLDLFGHDPLRLGDERTEVSVAHVGRDYDPTFAVLAADLVGTRGYVDACNGG